MTTIISHSIEGHDYIRHTIEPIANLHVGDIVAVEVISFSEKKAVFSRANFSNMTTQGEIVNILLKIKNSFLPTKQILIGL